MNKVCQSTINISNNKIKLFVSMKYFRMCFHNCLRVKKQSTTNCLIEEKAVAQCEHKRRRVAFIPNIAAAGHYSMPSFTAFLW